jgi:hypothetical protein
MWNDIVNANWMRANSNAVNPNMGSTPARVLCEI